MREAILFSAIAAFVLGCGDEAADPATSSTSNAGGASTATAGAGGGTTSSGTGAAGGGGTCGDMPPIPDLATWEADLDTWGTTWCAYIADSANSFDSRLAATYYDATNVFLQAAEYTGDPKWIDCATAAKVVYGDQYVLPNNGSVPGYWNFTNGLTRYALEQGDVSAEDAVLALALNAAYSSDSTPLDWMVHVVRSREVAYAIRAHLNAEKLGAAPRARTAELVDLALGHIDQWFISKTARQPLESNPPEAAGMYYIQPFMVGLTTEALILWEEKTGDPRVVPAIQVALDWLWDNAWVPADEAFWYDNFVADPATPFPPDAGAPDLNQLIGPAYAWLYKRTCDPVLLDRADQIFRGGVKGAYLQQAKQFNQSYCWSFTYVALRSP